MALDTVPAAAVLARGTWSRRSAPWSRWRTAAWRSVLDRSTRFGVTQAGVFSDISSEVYAPSRASTGVNPRRQAERAGFFDEVEDTPDEGFLRLVEVFNLDRQLDRLDH
jgi:hypothetical protein